MTRRPAERAMLAYLRDDAWRFDEPAERVRIFKEAIQVPGRFDAFELNVLYELLLVGSTVENIQRDPSAPLSFAQVRALATPDPVGSPGWPIDTFPFALLLAVAGVLDNPNHVDKTPFPPEWARGGLGADDPLAKGVVIGWREWTKNMRVQWSQWSEPAAFVQIMGMAGARVARMYGPDVAEASRVVVVTACETLIRLCWLYECEERDALTFGPVTERRLPDDEAERAITLRRFAEHEPEMRMEPALAHVAPREADAWLRPKDYAGLPMLPSDPRQTEAIQMDALTNRKYVHDHVAVIELDRKPIKRIILAPERYSREQHATFLLALVEHERGTFCCQVIVVQRPGGKPHASISLPFGSHAWRALPAATVTERHEASLAMLPPDEHVIALVIAAWRDLIVANVREQQYESETTRGGGKVNGKRPGRAQRRGHVRVVHYLPRTVVLRRAMEAAREANPGHSGRHLMTAFRVGCFSRLLAAGQQRSQAATDYAKAIGMPLTDRQTVVQPHVRGGTEADRQALLATDDVRLWRSWAALDLIHARRTGGGVE